MLYYTPSKETTVQIHIYVGKREVAIDHIRRVINSAIVSAYLCYLYVF